MTSTTTTFRITHQAIEELTRRANILLFDSVGTYLRDHCEGMAKRKFKPSEKLLEKRRRIVAAEKERAAELAVKADEAATRAERRAKKLRAKVQRLTPLGESHGEEQQQQ